MRFSPSLLVPFAIVIGFALGSSRAVATDDLDKRSGCCSYHGGVCGCYCCDGSLLSQTCLPYYPGCGRPSAPYSVNALSQSGTHVNVSWLPGSSNQDGFRVQCKDVTGGGIFQTVATLPKPARSAAISDLQPLTTYAFRVFADNGYGASSSSPEVTATTSAQPSTCVEDATTLCLGAGMRFKVRATFQTATTSGTATVVRLTDETGYLWFFTASNVEAVVKVLNACGVNSRQWVFAAGLTDQGVVITVTDTSTGASKTYANPVGRTFVTVTDTNAFATCP